MAKVYLKAIGDASVYTSIIILLKFLNLILHWIEATLIKTMQPITKFPRDNSLKDLQFHRILDYFRSSGICAMILALSELK